MVISTCVDQPWSCRFRARAQLIESRSAARWFTVEAAFVLLNEVMVLKLSASFTYTQPKIISVFLSFTYRDACSPTFLQSVSTDTPRSSKSVSVDTLSDSCSNHPRQSTCLVICVVRITTSLGCLSGNSMPNKVVRSFSRYSALSPIKRFHSISDANRPLSPPTRCAKISLGGNLAKSMYSSGTSVVRSDSA